MQSVHPSAPTEQAAPLTHPSTTTVDGRITAPVLVDVAWLERHRDEVRVLDTRAGSEFLAGHVPGSASLPLDALLVDDSSRPALERLACAARATLAARGVAPDDHVVLVDTGDGTAALGAIVCELAGLRRVTVVQGSGIDAWISHANQLTVGEQADAPAPVPAEAWADASTRTGSVAAFEDVVDAVVEGTAIVLDARSQLEHEGIVGAPCCAGRGAIPGSLHVEWTACFDMFGAPRPAAQVRELLDQLGISPDDRIIVTCHAGHRAAIAARVLRASGFRDVRVSLGSWHEWSLRGLGEDEQEDERSLEPVGA
jgi:thiosulfate/3-mercaptopyruvate sulfurtransferase